MLNFSNFAFLEEQVFVKENEGSSGVFENILFFINGIFKIIQLPGRWSEAISIYGVEFGFELCN